MGERKRKRERFFEEHPYCCFCGGSRETTTLDHVPNRACFPDRQAPEGFEFPACDECQGKTRLDEIAFAAMVHFLADDDDAPSTEVTRKLLTGLKNNLPHLLPIRELTRNEKRRAMRELQIARPSGLLDDVPMVDINPNWHRHITSYLHKIARAIYYKHNSQIAPKEWAEWSTWTYEKIGLNRDALGKWISITPNLDIGRRSNMNFGNRFICRSAHSPEVPAFATVGIFGRGLIFYAILTDDQVAARIKNDQK